ncbi:MAG: hypothetical protein HOI07_05850 [Betaproteobacteria bacterium]|jgi:hypothetical protein|nr:hypothetical protein [Betaproteobacteria bacterium]
MKRSTQNAIGFGIVILLSIYIGYLKYIMDNEKRERRENRARAMKVQVPIPAPINYRVPETEPEFRRPPIKQYKPGYVQQMGLLTGSGGETLPLYGKEVRGHRDRYNYYTSTSGEQIYSIPVTHNGRDCMDTLGCPELYDNNQVSVLGNQSPYDVKMYRTEHFF